MKKKSLTMAILALPVLFLMLLMASGCYYVAPTGSYYDYPYPYPYGLFFWQVPIIIGDHGHFRGGRGHRGHH